MKLLEWQYLIFLTPIALSVLYLLLMAVGLSFESDGADAADQGLDAGHDAGVDAEHDGALGLEHAGGTEIGHAAGTAHGHVSDGASVLARVLAVLGIGKAPFSVLMVSACVLWGIVGAGAVTMLGMDAVNTAIALAAVGAVVGTGRLASGLGRILPSVETHHNPLRNLVGLRGEVLYEVTHDSGMVRVHDEVQNQRDVAARVAAGADKLSAGTSVVLSRFDGTANVFFVRS